MRLRNLLVLALAALLLHLAGRPGLAAGTFAVFGVQPGMTTDEVKGVLGTPAIERKSPPAWCYRRGTPGRDDPTVMFDPSGRVRFVVGSRLDRDGKTVLRRGASIVEMKTALGETPVTKPGQGQTLLYVYDALKLTVVFSGNPARIAVFGLGEEPR